MVLRQLDVYLLTKNALKAEVSLLLEGGGIYAYGKYVRYSSLFSHLECTVFKYFPLLLPQGR